jgi:hypothetical protein
VFAKEFLRGVDDSSFIFNGLLLRNAHATAPLTAMPIWLQIITMAITIDIGCARVQAKHVDGDRHCVLRLAENRLGAALAAT